MQMEMEAGGKMYVVPNYLPFSGHTGISVILKPAYFLRPRFFDLFVAMCNHMDDISAIKSPR